MQDNSKNNTMIWKMNLQFKPAVAVTVTYELEETWGHTVLGFTSQAA